MPPEDPSKQETCATETTTKEPPAIEPPIKKPSTMGSSAGLTPGEHTPPFDLTALAAKLNCDPSHDSVFNAFEVLADRIPHLQSQVAFYESLFGYPTEYLMALHSHGFGLRKLDNVIFMGQQKLEGKSLQEAYYRRTGRMPSLEHLKGKSMIEEHHETHYDFVVVLPIKVKEYLDRTMSSK